MTFSGLPEFRVPMPAADPPADGYRVELNLLTGELEVSAARLTPAQELTELLGPPIGSRVSW